MNLFSILLLNFGSQPSMCLNSMAWSYVLLLMNLVQSWAEPNVNSLILPTTEEDFPFMAQQLLGISLDMAKRWCMPNKLNIHAVFTYFS